MVHTKKRTMMTAIKAILRALASLILGTDNRSHKEEQYPCDPYNACCECPDAASCRERSQKEDLAPLTDRELDWLGYIVHCTGPHFEKCEVCVACHLCPDEESRPSLSVRPSLPSN